MFGYIPALRSVLTFLGRFATLLAVAGTTASAERAPAITYAIRPPGDMRTMTNDAAGNVFVLGTPNTSFRATPGAAYPTRPDGRASYLLKLDGQGNPIFATFLPGEASYIAVDPNGTAYVLTATGSGFRFDPHLVLVDRTGTTATLQPVPTTGRIALDPEGYLYITSTQAPPGLPVTMDALQREPNNSSKDGYVVKLNPATGSIVYGTYLGGSDYDTINAIAVDATGNAYIGGETRSRDFPVTPSAYLTTAPQEGPYGFIAKLNPSGSALVYATYFRYVTDIAVDRTGAVIAAHGYLSKLSPDGKSLVFTTTLACCYSVAIDPSGNLVGIWSRTDAGFPTHNPLQAETGNVRGPTTCRLGEPPQPTACSDVTMAKFDPEGKQVLWSTSLGFPGDDLGGDVMVDAAGNIYAWMSGFAGFPLPGTYGGRYSIVKIEPVGPPPLFTSAGIVSSAGFKGRYVGSGSLVSLFGTGLTSVQGVVAAPSFPLPNTLEGTSVWFVDGTRPWFGPRQAPVLAVANVHGQEQMNVQLPPEAFPAPITPDPAVTTPGPIVIVKNGRALGFGFFDYGIRFASIFTDAEGRPVITHADFSPVSPASPVRAGETIIVFATGLGWVDPPVRDGEPAPATPLSRTAVTPDVRIGGRTAAVAFSGLTPGLVSVYQLNVIVPAVPPGDAALTIGYGAFVNDTARIAVQ